MDTRADEIVRRHDRLKSERSIWDSHWQELAERIWPDRALFTTKRAWTQGEKRTEKMFDATAALARPSGREYLMPPSFFFGCLAGGCGVVGFCPWT